jgi:hypothetical protein
MAYSIVSSPTCPAKDRQLPKPNYAFAKRQRDLIKKQKKEEKRQKKLGSAAPPPPETVPPQPVSDKAPE